MQEKPNFWGSDVKKSPTFGKSWAFACVFPHWKVGLFKLEAVSHKKKGNTRN